MPILMIRNAVKAVPSVELMRLLGASSSRGSDNLIGQFGSGFLYSLAVLARHNLLESLKVCLGTDVYTFSRKTHAVTDSAGVQADRFEIVMRKQGGATIPLGIDVQFGAMDWTCATMAIRELVSNAIDGARSFDSTTKSVVIESLPESTSTRAKAGVITIYVRTTPEIDRYITDIKKTFLCLNADYAGVQVFHNVDGGGARIYRKGVLVGTFGDRSLFHYDLASVKLKESRNVDSYEAEQQAVRAIMTGTDEDVMQQYLTKAVLSRNESPYWETNFNLWTTRHYAHHGAPESKAAWKAAVHAAVGNAVICEVESVERVVAAKGRQTIRASGDVADALKAGGLEDSSTILDRHELLGHDITPANANVLTVFKRVWAMCVDYGVTMSKPMPGCYCFRQNTASEGGRLGYYEDSAVYIRTDIQDDQGIMLLQTMIEEVSHHITGASDMTRDFQDFAFRLAAMLMSGSKAPEPEYADTYGLIEDNDDETQDSIAAHDHAIADNPELYF